MQIHELHSQTENTALIEFINSTAPDQTKFITEDYFKHGTNYAFGAFKDNKLIGAIRYCKQALGQEQRCPLVVFENKPLMEAKINVFAVRPDYRGQGVGQALQKHVMNHARKEGCYQPASYSTYDKSANYAVKLKLGFCVQPEKQADRTIGCYFLMRL